MRLPGRGADHYFPTPEADGGWSYAESDEEVRERAQLEPKVLALAATEQEWYYGGDSWCISIIRNGVLATDFRSIDITDSSRFDVWSVTKSFTSLAFGIIMTDPAYAGRLDLDSAAYEFIPEGHPLTDARQSRGDGGAAAVDDGWVQRSLSPDCWDPNTVRGRAI